MKIRPLSKDQLFLVYGQPKPKELDVPEEFEALGPVETSPNDFAVVPVKDQDGQRVYHYVQKQGLRWTVGPSTGKKYEQKPSKQKSDKPGKASKSRRTPEGGHSDSDGSGEHGESSGAVQETPPAEATEPTDGAD